jgi:hypothetical protein
LAEFVDIFESNEGVQSNIKCLIRREVDDICQSIGDELSPHNDVIVVVLDTVDFD